MRHIIVYKDPGLYVAFPSIARLPNGDLLVSFREAGQLSVDRARTGTHTHLDPDVRVCLLRSTDNGETWDPATKTVIYDEGLDTGATLSVLSDGVIVAGLNNLWKLASANQRAEVGGHLHFHNPETGLVGRVMGCASRRSFDGGQTWAKELVWVEFPAGAGPACDARTGVTELADGSLIWALCDHDVGRSVRAWLVHSFDRGATWGDPHLIAADPRGSQGYYAAINFSEPHILPLAGGRVIALLRTDPQDSPGEGYLYQADSPNWGIEWRPYRRTPMWGHPPHLLQLRSGAVLCTYGHRRPPYGVRACLSHDGGATWDIEHEAVLRADGLGRDLGYPYSVQLPDDTILTVYYIYLEDGVRHIAGTFWREEERG